MRKTSIIGTNYYCDALCTGKKLYLFHGFIPKDVTKYIIRIEMFKCGAEMPVGKTIRNSIIGGAIFGSLGSVIGAICTKPVDQFEFRIFFSPGLEIAVIDIITKDKYLYQWLHSRAKGDVSNGEESDFI